MKPVVLVLIVLFSSCKGQEKGVGNTEQTKSENRLQLVENENYSGFDDEEFIVVTDMKTLKKFYSTVNRTRKPGLPIPEIDFTKQLLLIYTAGRQQEAFEPRLSIVAETENRIILKVKNEDKGLASESIIMPFCIYKLPRTRKEISLK